MSYEIPVDLGSEARLITAVPRPVSRQQKREAKRVMVKAAVEAYVVQTGMPMVRSERRKLMRTALKAQ